MENVTVELKYFRVIREVTEPRELIICADNEDEARLLSYEADYSMWKPLKHRAHWDSPEVEPYKP